MKLKRILSISILATSIMINGANAQQAFSLKEAISYAIKNHNNVKNGQLDIQNADARVSEIKAMGLPQINGSVGYNNNLIVPSLLVPAKTFNPAAKDGEVSAVKFGLPHNSSAGLSLNQLVFDGSYTLGLKAADVYRELSTKSLVVTKHSLAENVAKAYYGILVNNERIKLLNTNIGRLDTLLRDTRAMNAQGFVEKLDVQRLEVQINNLKTEAKNINRLQDLSYYLLKFQMGMPENTEISLSDKLVDTNLSVLTESLDVPIDYNNRMEYSILKTQNRLAELDLKNTKASKLPRVMLNGNYGFNNGRESIGDIFTKSWFGSLVLGLSVQVPIFDGYARKYKTIQSANNLQKVQNSYKLLENGMDFQVKQANIALKNSWESLQENKKNMELAQEIVRVSKIKYSEGVGANLEILNAEAAYKEAQTNYFTSLYNALIAKVDMDKAHGKLPVE